MKTSTIYTITILFLCLQSSVHSATEITGEVKSRKGILAEVNFKRMLTPSIKKGDKVTFFTFFDGIKVEAGFGEIQLIFSSGVWVEVTDNDPQPGMKAIVQATGKSNPDRHIEYLIYKYDESPDKQIFNELLEFANKGNAKVQNLIGDIYFKGNGLDKNSEKAFIWYKKSALRGNTDAQFSLGNIYFLGKGKPKDVHKAFQWYKKAAELGDEYSQFNLGYLFSVGIGTTENQNQAFYWYKLAGNQNHTKAQHKVGVGYFLGKGVTKDFTKAFEWFKKAATKNHPKSQYNLGIIYANGYGLQKNIPEAIKWFKASAASGHPEAQSAIDAISPL